MSAREEGVALLECAFYPFVSGVGAAVDSTSIRSESQRSIQVSRGWNGLGHRLEKKSAFQVINHDNN